MHLYKYIMAVLLLSFLIIQGCKKDDAVIDPAQTVDTSKPIEFQFYPKWGASPLALNTKYVTSAGDTVQFSTLKFYISEPALLDSTGKEVDIKDIDATAKVAHGSGMAIWLVDMSATTVAANGYYKFQAKGTPGKYRGVKFSVGVPFSENHKDAATQEAPLGPNSGMYWGWNPGYIFHMIEGKADSAGQQRDFGYHVGEDNRKATIRLASFVAPVTELVIAASGNYVRVDVDYSKLFQTGMVNPAGPLRPKTNVSERIHHVGPKNLADRIFANSQLMFSTQP